LLFAACASSDNQPIAQTENIKEVSANKHIDVEEVKKDIEKNNGLIKDIEGEINSLLKDF